MTAAATPPRPYRRETTGTVPFDSFAASAEEVDNSAGCGECVALGWREADVECGFELIAELDQVKGVTSEIPDKGGVKMNLRRREVEVPRDEGLHRTFYRITHLGCGGRM